MKIVKYVILIISVYFLSGCSNKYPINYNSNPTGAAVICKGVNEGYTPITLYYELSSKEKEYGRMRTVPCTAQWISGVSREYSNEWDLKQFPSGVMQTVQRPHGEGYEKDARFALQVQQMQYQRQQAEAAIYQAEAASYNNLLNQQRNYQLQQQNNQLENLNNYFRYGY